MKILITGASRGIGRATALALARGGHQVLALARTREALESLAEEAEGAQPVRTLPMDLQRPDENALHTALAELGGLDVLINNAGRLINRPFLELTDADWQAQWEVNVLAVVRLLRLAYPFLAESPSAHVLNVSSMGGFQGSSKFPGLAAYSTTKGALSILTECLAEEWSDQGIAVNALALGAVQTEMLAEAFPGVQAPLTSEEIAGFFAFFATRGQQFFNGKVLPVSSSTP